MPTFKVTDPTSGKTVTLTGDSAPTEQELNEIFNQIGVQDGGDSIGSDSSGTVVDSNGSREKIESGGILPQGLKATGISASPSLGEKVGQNLQEATSKVVNQTKNIINSGLFGLPGLVSDEFEPDGLTPGEKLQGSLVGGGVIGQKVIDGALKGIKTIYGLPAIKESKGLLKATEMFQKVATPIKATAKGGFETAKKKISLGLNAIFKNKEALALGDDVGRLPRNIDEAVAAANQTRNNLLEQYTAMAKAAGDDVLIDASKVADAISSSQKGKGAILASKRAVDYAKSESERIRKLGLMTIDEAENAIRRYNQQLKPFYEKGFGSFDDVTRAQIDAKAASALRNQVDELVSGGSGKYQDLKNTYGAVTEVEKGLVKQLAKQARKIKTPGVGTLDTVPIIYGAFTGNTPLVAAGISQRIGKAVISRLRDPDVIIKNVFKTLDNSGGKTAIQSMIDLQGKGAVLGAIQGRE